MKPWIMFISLSLITNVALGAGRKAPIPVDPEPEPVVSVTPGPSPTTPQPPSSGDRIVFKPVDYYSTPAERKKIASAGKKVNEVIQSQCFFDFISQRKLIQTGGRTPLEVANHLKSLSGEVPVVMYYRKYTSAVAYRQPPEITINMNRKYFSPSMSDCDWAATMAHESVGHSLGNYGHDYNYNRARSFSVPYSIGGGDTISGGSAFDKCCH
jgi:hypothetical protein